MKKFLALLFVTGLGFTLVACGSTPNEDPQTVVNKFLTHIAGKTVDYKSGKIVLTGKGSLDAGGSTVALDGTTNVSFDSTDANNSKSDIKLDLKGNGNLAGKSANVGLKGEIRTLDKKLYVYLEDLTVDSPDQNTSMMANLFGGFLKGKWNEIPGAVNTPDAGSLEVQNVTAEQIQLIATNNPFLTVVKDLGNRTYQVKVDSTKLKAYLTDLGKANNTPPKPEDMDALDKMLVSFGDYDLELQIDGSYELQHFKTDIKIDDPTKNQQMTVNVDASFTGDSTQGSFDLVATGDQPAKLHLEGKADHTTSAHEDILVPADAKVFDMNQILGGLGGGLPPDGSTPPDASIPSTPGMPDINGTNTTP